MLGASFFLYVSIVFSGVLIHVKTKKFWTPFPLKSPTFRRRSGQVHQQLSQGWLSLSHAIFVMTQAFS